MAVQAAVTGGRHVDIRKPFANPLRRHHALEALEFVLVADIRSIPKDPGSWIEVGRLSH
jgi:hypothetical protein